MKILMIGPDAVNNDCVRSMTQSYQEQPLPPACVKSSGMLYKPKI